MFLIKKSFIVVASFFVLFGNSLFSQDADKPWAFELSTGKNEYRGDRGNGYFLHSKDKFISVGGVVVNDDYLGLGLTRYVNPNFDGTFQLSNGYYGIDRYSNTKFSGTKTDASALVRYKFNNGYLLSEESFFAPYITAGLGFAYYSGDDIGEGSSLFIPFGIGLKLKFSPDISLQSQLLFNLNFDDKADKKVDGSNDNFIRQTLSLVICFGNSNGSNSNRNRLYYKR